jgi:hypothetical protein
VVWSLATAAIHVAWAPLVARRAGQGTG